MFTFNFKKRRIEIEHQVIVMLIMLVFTLLYFLESRDLSYEALLFPRFLFTCIAITGFFSIKKCVRFVNLESSSVKRETQGAHGFKVSKKQIIFTLLTSVTIIAFSILGAVLSILLFLLLSMVALGVKSKLQLALIPIGTVLFIYFVFQVWLSVPLPTGFLGF